MPSVPKGPITLEVYKKPTKYNRQSKPVLLTIKNFYLHLELALDTAN